LPALLAIVLLVGGAWWLRRRYPALALAALFYFAGQLLESTSLPLELYFEHRNYLPAMLMFWPLGLWLADTGKLMLLKRTLMIVLPLGLAVMTFARAQLWGNVQTQALVWAQINPQSGRAQANAAQIEIAAGQPRPAIQRLQPLLAAQPDQVQLAFNLIGARCLLGGVSPTDIAAARQAMQTTNNPGVLFTSWFNRTLPSVAAGDCRGLTLADLHELISAGLHNPKLSTTGPQQDLTYLRGRIALAQQQPDAALADFTQALDLQVRPGMALQAAATLGAAGYPAQGLRLLDHYQQVEKNVTPPGFGMPMLHAWVLARQNYWPHELANLRHQLSLDVTANNANTARSTPDPGAAR
jgi:tetratricopeptide (TPR) repeat protein